MVAINDIDANTPVYSRITVDMSDGGGMDTSMGYVCEESLSVYRGITDTMARKTFTATLIPMHKPTGAPIGEVPPIKVEVYEGKDFRRVK